MARLLVLMAPVILITVLAVVAYVLYNWYKQGGFNNSSFMLQNPITGVYTRIELDEIRTVEITDDVESVLFYKDGTRITIKTKDANRLMRALPKMS